MSDDQTMNAYGSKFHDGFVDGFLIREPQVIVFIRTYDNKAFAEPANCQRFSCKEDVSFASFFRQFVTNVGQYSANQREIPLVRRAICVYDFMNSRRSALIWSACVVGIPCGRPL
jgi:hypothetical protein